LPLAASDRTSLEQKLYTLQKSITDTDSLPSIAKETLINYHQSGDLPYAIVILGKNKQDLLREIDRAWKGVAQAFETGQDWQTPLGSCFTVNPQGKKGKIAYVYPGAYNAHLGLGRNLFRLFPQLFDDLIVQSTRNRLAKLEKLLYPRSLTKLSRKQLETKEKKLLDDALAMLESETGFAGLMTTVLRDYFQVKPQGSFGYSLGEISAMYSQGVWTDVAQSSDQLNASSLFKNRLAGAKNAVREYWQLPPTIGKDAEIWGTYVLMTSATAVQAQIKHTSRVYLTQISTPKEVVIAGDPQACQQLIKELNCDSFRAPFNHVIHCEAMASEYHELVRLHSLPVQNQPATKFYSAAQYQPINYDSQAIAQNLSQTLCQQLDFPRLVNQVYQDGFRIFIEVGAGSNCSRWIGEILKYQEHLTVSLNRRGIDDHVSLLKALAKLLAHRVELDLSPLYGQVKTNSNNTISSNSNQDSFVPQPSLENQFMFSEKLSKDNSKMLKVHTNFLQYRQAHSDDSSELIMLQFALLQRRYVQEN
jgi:PfaB family protein